MTPRLDGTSVNAADERLFSSNRAANIALYIFSEINLMYYMLRLSGPLGTSAQSVWVRTTAGPTSLLWAHDEEICAFGPSPQRLNYARTISYTRARSQHRSLLRTDTPFPANIIIIRLRSAAADSSRPPERRRLTGGGNGGGGGGVLIPGEAPARRPTQSVRNHRVGSVTNVTILD